VDTAQFERAQTFEQAEECATPMIGFGVSIGFC